MDSLEAPEWPSLASVKASQQYPNYYENYYRQLDSDSGAKQLVEYYEKTIHFWRSLDSSLAQYAYEPGKWTLAQMLQHVIDTERVFGYRILRMAREDQPLLKSFDHNHYAEIAPAHNLDWDHLLKSLEATRQSNLFLLQSLAPTNWAAEGHLGDKTVALSAVAWVIPGHDLHHQKIARERYLS